MKTKDIIANLLKYKMGNNSHSITKDWSVDFLVEYLSKIDIPYEREYDFYRVEPYLPVLLLRALTLLRESNEDWVKSYRDRYSKIMNGKKFGDAISVGSFTYDSCIDLIDFKTILKDAIGSDGMQADYSELYAESLVLSLHFNQFINKIYIQCGMREIIKSCEFKGIGGKFGKTELRTWDGIGRMVFTFARTVNGKDCTVSFIFQSDDEQALGAGIQSCTSDVITALTMIKDVSDNWDPSKFLVNEDLTPFPGL